MFSNLLPKMDGSSDFDFETIKEMIASQSREAALLELEEVEPPATPQELEQEYWPFLVKRV